MQTVPVAAPPAGATAPHRIIRKVAVLGAGIMGSRIALHFANIGVEALLLDMVPRELNDAEKAAGLTLESPKVRRRIVQGLYDAAVKGSPSPVYEKSALDRVSLGTFDDDLKRVAEVDWIIEVVVERLDIKQGLFEKLEAHRRPGTLITSNTSSIPINQLAQGRSEDFRRHFAGTHFFNPPRYLPLLEIIPITDTDPAVVDFLMHYGDLYLGKRTVLCKDTPAFIANRVGVFGFYDLFHLVEKYGLSPEEVDKLTGPILGRAKSATFRTSDIVGLDTSVKVAQVVYDNTPSDERRERFNPPAYVKQMVEKQLYGDKSGGGFFKKVKGADGSSEILSLDLKTLEYKPQQKFKSKGLEAARAVDSTPDQIKAMLKAEDKYGDFLRELHYSLFAYASHRIPEISDELYRLDQALCAGFGWDFGPFETWDILGAAETTAAMKAAGYAPAPWVDAMLAAGHTRFYTVQGGQRHFYDLPSKAYRPIPGGADFIILDALRESKVVWSNSGTSLFDLGDGVLNLEFQTKMNTIGGEVLEGINRAIDLAEKQYLGLVIGNQGENFSVGANLAMLLMMAGAGEWDELAMAVRMFQNTAMRVRYSGVPVVVAPHTMSLGGACEFSMHADSAVAAAETYMGLVEAGVGLLPGGGGTKEMAMRAADEFRPGDIEVNNFQHYFLNAAMAKVATSAHEAFSFGLLQHKKDRVVINKARQLAEAKRRVLELAEPGYTPAQPRKDIRVPGRTLLGAIMVSVKQMVHSKFVSEHDSLIAEKIGYVMCGGDLSYPQMVSEQYLLDLEREAFLQLCGTQKTLERIQHMLQTGKPLRN